MKYFIIYVALFLIWLYALTIFKRKKIEFFHFLAGSVGMFFFLFFVLEQILTPYLIQFVCFLTGLLGSMTNLFEAYSSYGILFIHNINGPISLYVDFECAGLIEILVFISLISFYNVYRLWEKIGVCIAGIALIMFSNVIRLFSICLIINFYGNESYYFAHTIVGRLLFYGLSIILYFYVFTRTQIRKQRVGEFGYADEIGK